MRLKDKVAIVTGGARGIGKAISELFAKEGAVVIIWDLLDEGTHTAAEINSKGGKAEFYKISVADKKTVTDCVKNIYDKYGKIDILINNAGIVRDKTLLNMSEEEFDLVINVNLKGVFICTQAVAPYMKQNNYGKIVTASSISGLQGNFGQTNYAAAKAGVIGMSKTWAVELGKFNITVNCVAPGFTITEMTATIPQNKIDTFKEAIPLRTVADSIDQAYGYLYLASDESRFVTGICITIDGGASL